LSTNPASRKMQFPEEGFFIPQYRTWLCQAGFP
jgi:hypothetical protein